MNTSTDQEKLSRKPSAAAGAGVASAIAALIGASCCVLPIILFHLGIGTALIGTLTFLAQSTTFFLIAAIAFIAVGVILSFRGGRLPNRTATILFTVATAIVIVAYALPSYEGEILRALDLR